jgi:hypothetical protein
MPLRSTKLKPSRVGIAISEISIQSITNVKATSVRPSIISAFLLEAKYKSIAVGVISVMNPSVDSNIERILRFKIDSFRSKVFYHARRR